MNPTHSLVRTFRMCGAPMSVQQNENARHLEGHRAFTPGEELLMESSDAREGKLAATVRYRPDASG